MLINNTDEYKAYIPVNITLDFDDIRPKVSLVEREIIQRLFSLAVYNRLTAIESGLSTEELALKKLLAESVAHLALLEYIPFAQLQISSSGIQITSNDSMKTAFEWQIDELKTTCSKQGWAAIESALEYCETLPDGDLKTAWTTSISYQNTQDQLIPTLNLFQKFVHLHHSRILFNKLSPIRIQQQDEVIIPAVGSTLWEKILSYTTESDENKKKILTHAHTKASRALAYATMGEGFQDAAMILSDNGPLIIEGMQSRLAKAVKTTPKDWIDAVATTFKSRAAGAIQELLQFCQENSDVLTEYQDSTNFITEADQTDHIPRNDPNWGIAFF